MSSLRALKQFMAVAAVALSFGCNQADSLPLDPSFGNGNGIGGLALGGQSNGPKGLALQQDGRFVIAAACTGANDYDFCVARFTQAGLLDTTFNGSGFTITPVGSDQDVASAIALHADGRIVVAGRCGTSTQQFCAVRYTAAGTLDTSFNGVGKVFTSIGTGQETVVTGLAIQADQKIVVSGYCTGAAPRAFCAARYNENGSLDTSFNAGATNTPPGTLLLPLRLDSMSWAMVLQADQKIILVGDCFDVLSGYAFCAARLNSDGTLDTSFNSTGMIVASANGNETSVATAVALQNDGSIVMAGNCYGSGYERMCAQRLTASGAVDTAFGNAGAVQLPIGSGVANSAAVLVQADGRLVVAGSCQGTSNTDFCTVRLNRDGSLDISFNGGGKLITPVSDGRDAAAAAVLQPDGKLVLAGVCGSATYPVCLVRYGLACSLDIDGDGLVLATTDALIFARVSLGLRGDPVIAGINFAATAPRKSWAAIRDYLAGSCGQALTP